MYRAGIEGILGLRKEGAILVVTPCIPDDWLGFEATIRSGTTHCRIIVEKKNNSSEQVDSIFLDGVPITTNCGEPRVPLDGTAHVLRINR